MSFPACFFILKFFVKGGIIMELNHVGTRTLKTTRLVLRPFCLSDAQAMYDNWASDRMLLSL